VKHGRRELTITVIPTDADEQEIINRIARATAVLLRIAERRRRNRANVAEIATHSASDNHGTSTTESPSPIGASPPDPADMLPYDRP
jgi:hypothetical protein